jgi:nucleotide-binding universal stress UspA family protein
MHRTILVSAPAGPELRDALSLAIGLARPRGAEIVVLPRLGDPPGPGFANALPHDVPIILAPEAAGDPESLHAAAAGLAADVLVVDPAAAREVAHHAPCAVAAAPAGAAGAAPAEPQRITVAWDGSAEADEALEWAVQLAERTAGVLRLVHVVEHASVGRVAGPEARLEEMRVAVAQRAPATVELHTGHAVDELIELRDLDLLVLGSRDHGPLLSVVLGSVAAGVLEAAPCPVVVLPRGVHAPVETTV